MYEFDAFISYNRDDAQAVEALDAELRLQGVRTFIDSRELPGERYQNRLAEVIQSASTALVVLGPSGVGGWQELEIQACVQEHVRRKIRIIPLLLPGVDEAAVANPFLKQFNWLGLDAQDAVSRLVWALKGTQPPLTESASLVTAENEARAERVEDHPLVDAWEVAIIKERLHNVAMVIAQYAAEQAEGAAEMADHSDVRIIPMIVDFRWRRGYASGLSRLLRPSASFQRLRAFEISEPDVPCGLEDGMLSATLRADGRIEVRLDGVPAVMVSEVPESLRDAVIESVNSHGRLGTDLDGSAVRDRIGDLQVSLGSEPATDVVSTLFKNREGLAPLVARFGLQGAEWMLAEEGDSSIVLGSLVGAPARITLGSAEKTGKDTGPRRQK